MTDLNESQQGVATGAVAAQSASPPPHVLQPSPSSGNDHQNASALEQSNSAHKQVADHNEAVPVPIHQQQQYQQQYYQQHHYQQHHGQYLSAPPLPPPQHYHQTHIQQNSFAGVRHDQHHRYPQIDGYQQHPAYAGHYYQPSPVSPHHGSLMQGVPQYAYAPSISPTQRDMQLPPPDATYQPSGHTYYAPQYPRSMPTPSIRDDRFANQMATTPVMESQRPRMYHSYHMSAQNSPGLPASSPLPMSPLPESEEKVKASTIYAPKAGMDGTATNYGRLPDGKIIELYPAMMRTMQACEYCRSRKAKCSGGLPCERCEDKGKECNYAQIDTRRKIKTTTSERDLSKRSSRSIKTVSSAKGGSGSGASVARSASPTKTTSTRPTRKSARNRGSAKPDYTEALSSSPSIALSVIEDEPVVPLDLSSSPFTPASLLYQSNDNKQQQIDQMSAPLLSVPSFTPQFATITQPFHQSSPASTASQTSSSIDLFAPSPAPQANFSPMPYFANFYQDAGTAWSHEEVAAPSAPQESAFRGTYTSTQHSNFF